MPNLHFPITYKTDQELKIMAEAGQKLAAVKKQLKELIKKGNNAAQIEERATALILESGAKPSFKMVPGYSWTTCVNVNAGVVHGIPQKSLIFKDNDLVSVDLGLYYQGFHSDSSFSCLIGKNAQLEQFLSSGEQALALAIEQAVSGKRIYDISAAIAASLNKARLTPIKSLVGHGIGKNLHEEPEIPCFTPWPREKTPEIKPGMTLAIEVMYTTGSGEIEIGRDGWTIRTRDGKIAGLFEETIAVTKTGTEILTA